jgi:hypothetical protein
MDHRDSGGRRVTPAGTPAPRDLAVASMKEAESKILGSFRSSIGVSKVTPAISALASMKEVESKILGSFRSSIGVW